MHTDLSQNALLDISVISTVIYCISPSIILQIPFTVKTVIPFASWEFSVTSDPTYRDLLYFCKMAVYCICRKGLFGAILLRVRFIFLISYIWIDTICPTPCLQCRNSLGLTTLETCYIACNDGKSVCPSCQRQHDR